jgi:ABC-type multidrug transport system fused ATPase/permease subunit
VAIARSLLKRPDLLIIDHATAALDPASQSAIMKMLLGDSTGMGLVWVLNDIEEASGFDRAIVMEGGKIVEQGPVNELRQSVQFAHVAAD